MAAHADAHDADLADAGVAQHLGCTQLGHHLRLEQVQRLGQIVAVYGEAEVGLAVFADVLDDHIDFHIGIGHSTQNLVGDAGPVGHGEHGDLGFIAVEGNTGNDSLFHGFVILKSDQGARLGFFGQVDVPRGEARQDADRHAVLAGKFHRAYLQHLGAHAGHFQHFLEADALQAAGFGYHARVGGIDAIDIGVDQALHRTDGRRHGDGRGIRPAAPQRGHVACRVDALKAGDDDHLARRELGFDAAVIDRFDAGLGVGVVGANRYLPA